MSQITQVSSSSQFQKLLSSNTYVITDFYADWCGPCKVIAPVFEQLAKTEGKPGKVAFAKVNVDEQQDITQQYGVSAMPTFLILKNGSVKETIRGANPSALQAAVRKAAADAGSGPGSSGAAFQSKGHTLGSGTGSSSAGGARRAGATASGAGAGFSLPGTDTIVRFTALYFQSLFSMDAYAGARASPFSIPS